MYGDDGLEPFVDNDRRGAEAFVSDAVRDRIEPVGDEGCPKLLDM
jgi:hypothetical protein